MRFDNPQGPNRKEADYGMYLILHGVAMRIALRFYAAELPDFPIPDDGLGLVPPAAVRHRVDRVQRQHPTARMAQQSDRLTVTPALPLPAGTRKAINAWIPGAFVRMVRVFRGQRAVVGGL